MTVTLYETQQFRIPLVSELLGHSTKLKLFTYYSRTSHAQKEIAAMTQIDLTPIVEEPAKLGRKRDHTRDPEILDAALEVLAETGYDGMTVDMVAARAKAGKATLYRRWPSKAELVIDAVACMKRVDPEAPLPDTGSLRGDLIALIKPQTLAENENKLRIMAGLMSMITREPELAEAANNAIMQPRAQLNRRLMQRAQERGEIAVDCDLDTLALISPSMVAYRVLMQRKSADREFIIHIIDTVLLPAMGLKAP
jgi:AcrR family transcriptional regulator